MIYVIATSQVKPELRDAFIKAAMALPSEGDRGNVLAAAARQ